MKECNFAGQMEKVSRIFLFFLTLLISTGEVYSDPDKAFLKGEDFSVFEENGKVGLKNHHGDVLIPAQYEAMGWSDGRFSIIDQVTGYRVNGLWGLINIANNRVTTAEYLDLSPGEGSLIVGRKKMAGSLRVQAGCIDTSGKEIIPFQYDGLRTSSFRAIVYVRSGAQFRHGLIDYENNALIPVSYRNIYPLGSLRYGVESFDNKTAIFSDDGKQITGFVIDSLSAFIKNFAILYQKQNQGLIDREGRIRVEPVYREIRIHDDGKVSARKADEWVFLNGNNDRITSHRADSVIAITSGLLAVHRNGRIGLAHPDFRPATDALFTRIGPFQNGKAVVSIGNRAGIIDARGALALQPDYNHLIIDGNLIRANRSIYSRDRWILLDSTGRTVSRNHYEYIAAYNGKFFPVRNRGYWGAIDATGKEIIACVHDSLLQQRNGLVVVRFKGAYGIIDLEERWIVTPQPDSLEILNDTLFLARSASTTFLKSTKGDLIYFSGNPLEPAGDHFLERLPSGMVWKIDFSGVIADRGTQSSGIEFLSGEKEGLRAIKKDGRYGFVDDLSRLRIANRYEAVRDFSGQLAAVMIRGRWGFINHQDQLVIQPYYDEACSFRGDFARVRQKNAWGVIDRTGSVVLPVRYEEVIHLDGDRFMFRHNGAWGLADSMGRIITNAKFDFLRDLGNGYVIVSRNAKSGLLNIQGVSTVPLQYDALSYDPYHDQYIALKKADWETLDLR